MWWPPFHPSLRHKFGISSSESPTRHRTIRSNASSSPAPLSLNNEPPAVAQLNRAGRPETYPTPPSNAATVRRRDCKCRCELFLQRLPDNVRMVLAFFEDTQLAKLGDSIISAGSPGVAAFTHSQPSNELQDLRKKNQVDIGPAAERAFRGWSGNRVYSPYTVRNTLTFDSWYEVD